MHILQTLHKAETLRMLLFFIVCLMIGAPSFKKGVGVGLMFKVYPLEGAVFCVLYIWVQSTSFVGVEL